MLDFNLDAMLFTIPADKHEKTDLMRILKENIRQRLHLPYLSWKRSIRQQVEKQKRMRSTESVHCMPHIYSRTDIKVIQQSGTTLCMYL